MGKCVWKSVVYLRSYLLKYSGYYTQEKVTDRLSIFEVMNKKGNHFFFLTKTCEFLLKMTDCSKYIYFGFLVFSRKGYSPVKEKFPSGSVILTSKLTYGKFSTSLPELMVQGERNRFFTLIFHPSELFLIIWRGIENEKVKIMSALQLQWSLLPWTSSGMITW